jgi:hypothetical protein
LKEDNANTVVHISIYGDAWKNPKEWELKVAKKSMVSSPMSLDAWKNPKEWELKVFNKFFWNAIRRIDAWKNPKEWELKVLRMVSLLYR